jgi:RluA family pseudouridine synthase
MIPILVDTDSFLAANKPEGLASIPGSSHETNSLLSILEASTGKKLFRVHRIDKDASGVILFAKDPETHRYLNDQFERREVQKTYRVLVHNVVEVNSGEISKPIRQFGSGRMGVDAIRGKPSLTNFELAKRFKDYTLLNVMPVTGRRHQIRVHFYSLGHPVVGDLTYGQKSLQKAYPRLMLHASAISLALPSGNRVKISAPIPISFDRFIETLLPS